jgi:hypothetical protein
LAGWRTASWAVNRLKVAGLSFKRGDDGKLSLKKVSLPGLTYKRQADGKMRLTHFGSKSGGMDFALQHRGGKGSKLGAMRFGSSTTISWPEKKKPSQS